MAKRKRYGEVSHDSKKANRRATRIGGGGARAKSVYVVVRVGRTYFPSEQGKAPYKANACIRGASVTRSGGMTSYPRKGGSRCSGIVFGASPTDALKKALRKLTSNKGL